MNDYSRRILAGLSNLIAEHHAYFKAYHENLKFEDAVDETRKLISLLDAYEAIVQEAK